MSYKDYAKYDYYGHVKKYGGVKARWSLMTMNRNLRKIVYGNLDNLLNSDKTMKAVYSIMFSATDNIMTEQFDGYRIIKHTYGEVKERVERTASAIYKKIGATHGFVGLEMENSEDWIVAFWAILKSGNKACLVNTRHPQNLSNQILADLKVKYVVGNKPTRLNAEYLDIADLKDSDACPDDVFENEFSLATSGTTLKETICFYTGAEVSSQLLDSHELLNLSVLIHRHYHGSLKLLCFLPFYHIFGLSAVYFWFGFFGRTFVFLKDMTPDTILKTVRRHEVTHIFAVPMLWHAIESSVRKSVEQQGKTAKLEKGLKICNALQNIEPRIGNWLSKRIMHEVTDQVFGKSIEFCINGGSYIRESALTLMNGLGYTLHNGYGMTEVQIASVDMRNKPKYLNQNSIGRPFGSIQYRINEEGILEIKGDSISHRGITNGKPVVREDWFATGDIAEEIDGYLYLRGRKGDLVIGENGENINPDMVEQNFTIPAADQFCVLGLPSEQGEQLSMVVQINRYLTQEDVDNIAKDCYATNEQMAPQDRVRKFYFTYDEISAKGAVKVGRSFLLRALEGGVIRLTPFDQMRQTEVSNTFDPNSELAKKIRHIIAEEMDLDDSKVGDDSHVVFDLGAGSLQYLELLTILGDEFDIDFSDSESYRYTVRDFCEMIEEKQ